MDVGAPSNFTRLLALYDNNYNALKADVSGFHLNDEDDKQVMKDIYNMHSYIADPYGAIGYAAVKL